MKDIIGTSWNITNGVKVPQTEDIVLRNGGRLVDATYLYADLAGSSMLAQGLEKEAAAKIIRAYINTAARILRHKDGEIRSFDGDRVMAIFMGADKEDRAVRAAMGIHWAVVKVIRHAIREGWSDGDDFCNIDHGIGIDSGESLIVRGGVRDNNDLISVGAAPNVAAKLSDIRSSQSIFVTDRVRDALSSDYLTYDNGKRIWTRLTSSFNIGGSQTTVFGTGVYWRI